MLECEDYKMFKGTMRIAPLSTSAKAFEKYGVWLYKPLYDCWYCERESYPANICTVVEDLTNDV